MLSRPIFWIKIFLSLSLSLSLSLLSLFLPTLKYRNFFIRFYPLKASQSKLDCSDLFCHNNDFPNTLLLHLGTCIRSFFSQKFFTIYFPRLAFVSLADSLLRMDVCVLAFMDLRFSFRSFIKR